MITKLRHLAFATLILGLVGCATTNHGTAWRQGNTTINVTGTPGSQITGFFVQDGQRHEVAGSLPFTLNETGLSEVEIRKVNLNDAFKVETRYADLERHLSFANMAAAPGVPGVRVELRNGFSVENLRK